MGFTQLGDEDIAIINENATAIKGKKKTMLEFIELLRNDFSNVDTQEQGLTKLYRVLEQLPNAFLDETEVGSLLEFLLSRLEASALRNGCVVTCIHHLIVNSKNLPSGCEIPIFQAIYSESTVQCFTQADRALLFEILEFFLEHRQAGLKTLGSEFILCFMRACNGERDPRCLLQIFKLFLDVTKNFDLGVYCEDMFELMAVYFPLEYIPTDALKVSREMLASGLENCLLSHKSFSFYCYQLISSKLYDEEYDDKTKIEICGFLAKAATIFPPEPMQSYTDDYLTEFRRLCLNPSNKTSNEIPVEIQDAVMAIFKAWSHNADATKTMANTMTENCEPFILQAELGLTAKALNLLSIVCKASKQCSELILPQIMFWLGNLINADTINAPQNRQELITEAIQFLPHWLELSFESDCIKAVTDAMPGFIESLKRAEQQFDVVVFPVEYKLAEILLTQSLKFKDVSIPSEGLFEKLVRRSVTDLRTQNPILTKAVQDFTIAFAKSDFETFAKLVEKEQEEKALDATLLEFISFGITNKESYEKFGNTIMNAFKQGIDFNSVNCITGIIDRNKEDKLLCEKLIFDSIAAVLEHVNNISGGNNLELEAELLQELLLRIDQSNVDELLSKIVDQWQVERPNIIKVTSLACLQAHKPEILEKALNIVKLEPSLKTIYNYLLFALTIRDPKCAEPSAWITLKAELLLNRPKALENLNNYLISIVTSNDHESTFHLSELFDFDARGYNPTKNRYPVSFLWRQRILCQFIPIYVSAFSKLSSKDTAKRRAFLEVLSPILSSAQKLTVPLTSELLYILPVLTEALESLADEDDSVLLDLVIDGCIQLLKQVSLDLVEKEILERTLMSLQKILTKPKPKLGNVIKILEALELFGKKAPSEVILPAYSSIIAALITATSSNKRIVRQKAAAVRNQWELATT